ncbi:MAG: hypothetical protein OXG35_11380 [Acidobacteria bacterium]|nr:hypothetical protein [Acidobacteriota bacterium]
MNERKPPRNGVDPPTDRAGRTRYRLRVPGQLSRDGLTETRDALMDRAVSWLSDTVACVIPGNPSIRIEPAEPKGPDGSPMIEFAVTVDETLAESQTDELMNELVASFAESLALTGIDPEDIDAHTA